MEVGDVDAKAQRLMVAVDDKLTEEQLSKHLLTHVIDDKKEYEPICNFCLFIQIFNDYTSLGFLKLHW